MSSSSARHHFMEHTMVSLTNKTLTGNTKTWNSMSASSARHHFTEHKMVNFANNTLTGQCKRLKLNVLFICPSPFYWIHNSEFYRQDIDRATQKLETQCPPCLPITILLSTQQWIHWLDNAKTWNLTSSLSANHHFIEYATVNFTDNTLTGQRKMLKLIWSIASCKLQ